MTAFRPTLLRRLLIALLAILAAMPASAVAQPGIRHLALELIPESATPAPGGETMLAIHARPDPGWHGYWTNPGDAGVPDRFDWTLPAGMTTGPVAYPTPHRLMIAGIMNYVYEGDYAMLVPLRIPAGARAGTRLPISVKIDYLVCTREICVPETATLATAVTIGDGAVDPATRQRFDAWRMALPRPLGGPAAFAVEGEILRIAVPLPASVAAGEAYVFPSTPGLIDHSAPQAVTRDGDRLVIAVKAGPEGARAARIDGVLSLAGGRGLALSAIPGQVTATAPDPAGAGAVAILAALGGAILGGLILNIMPCVFPILSLKALSLAKSGASEAHARSEALAYSAGVIAVCLALGALLLALRAGGSAVGWAFQLTEPRVILILLLVVVAIALNLAGLFEIGGSQAINRIAASGRGGAFLTGALAAFVATPCTGPFMAGAMGAALVLPTWAALAVFAGLGLGIALPFLAIGFVPALRRRLPRPGAWMVRLRHLLSVPMFLTALALAWVLGQQAGVDGMAIGLAAALALSLGLWWAGRRQAGGRPAWIALAPAMLIAVGLVVLTERAPASTAAAPLALGEPFSEARLAAARAQNRPVFAYFTADWCLTCKVNEKSAIETQVVRDAFSRSNTAVLVGDWTDGDPVLGRFIESHGRSGVPLYLYYPPGAARPRVLPQVLTQGMLSGLAGGLKE